MVEQARRKEKSTADPKTKQVQVDQLLAQLPAAGMTDTAYALVEIYESIERSYRAAMMAGVAVAHSTKSTTN